MAAVLKLKYIAQKWWSTSVRFPQVGVHVGFRSLLAVGVGGGIVNLDAPYDVVYLGTNISEGYEDFSIDPNFVNHGRKCLIDFLKGSEDGT